MTLELPGDIAWPLHRIATSGKYHDSLHVIESEWSLLDLQQANEVLDAYEDAEAQAIEEADCG